ncbi:MAG: DMT family transporter [Chloroflexota bacterium]
MLVTAARQRRLSGVILVVISAASFGTLAILGRYAYAQGMDTLTILFLRFSLSALLLVALRQASARVPGPGPHPPPALRPRRLVWLQLVGMGAIGYVGQSYAYLTALKYASSGLVALLLYLYPIFVVFLSAIWPGVVHECITLRKLLAFGLALAGLALTVGPQGGQALGIFLALLAAAIYSVYIVVGAQVLKQVSAIQSSTVIFASAGASFGLLLALSALRGGACHLPSSGAAWLVIVLLVLLATVLPVVTFLAGLERIGASNAAMLSTLEPVVTVLLAAWLLGESLPAIALLGGGLILVAVLLSYSQ